jgi:hypothetical protein
VYKCGFRNILSTPPLENTVHNVVNLVTKTCYQVSRLLQLHIQRIIENSKSSHQFKGEGFLGAQF